MGKSTKGRQFLPDIFTDAEVQLMLKQCNPRYPTGCRNRALIAVLYRSGIRISEALGLSPKDVTAASGELRVHWGKGGRSRVVGMDAGAFALVEQWMVMRAGLGVGPKSPVFCTLKGGAMAKQYTQEMLGRIGRKAGIEKRVHAHGFRHTFAAQMLAEGADVGLIGRQLGHKSIATTVRYLEHVSPRKVVEWVSGREWGVEAAKRELKAELSEEAKGDAERR